MLQLKFEKDLQITKMYSAEGEEVALSPPMYPLGNVEIWIAKVRHENFPVSTDLENLKNRRKVGEFQFLFKPCEFL